MAKRKQHHDQVAVAGQRGESIGSVPLAAEWPAEQQAESAAEGEQSADSAAPNPQSAIPNPQFASVSAPIVAELSSEFPIHIDITLTPPAATVLRRIAIALDRQQAVTLDGQRVTKPHQALRWMLEQMEVRHDVGSRPYRQG